MQRCERLDIALRDRTWTLAASTRERRWTGLLVLSGSAAIDDGAQSVWIEPAMLYLGSTASAQWLRVRAGSEGILFAFNQGQAATATSGATEGGALAQLLEHPLAVRLGTAGFGLTQTVAALEWWMSEDAVESPGRATLGDAVLKLVLVAALRNVKELAPARRPMDRRAGLLQRFRQLLEAHFRERWRPAHYADALGVSGDWLHEVCCRELGRAPSVLIAERQNFEAKLLLRNSTDPVSVLAARLGFRDPSHFSKRFSQWNAESPRAFRQRLARSESDDLAAQIDMADWP
ncbi:MAG: AraC family transcriptional regulator [Pseudomonadota bacterium]